MSVMRYEPLERSEPSEPHASGHDHRCAEAAHRQARRSAATPHEVNAVNAGADREQGNPERRGQTVPTSRGRRGELIPCPPVSEVADAPAAPGTGRTALFFYNRG